MSDIPETDAPEEPSAESLSPAAFNRAVSHSVMAHAVSLAMQNAVAQQQQAYTLINATTTAATQAILDSKIEEAEAAVRLARELLSPDRIVETLSGLKKLMDELELPAEPPAS